MSTVMITGANRGLGLEFARQYAKDGWSVIATCRKPEDATALNAIDGVTVYPLNVTNFRAVRALADQLQGTAIDVLINNAGVYGPKGSSLHELDFDVWEQVLRTNTLGPLCVAQCFAAHVVASDLKCIATLTSKMGSMADNTSGEALARAASQIWDLEETAIERGLRRQNMEKHFSWNTTFSKLTALYSELAQKNLPSGENRNT